MNEIIEKVDRFGSRRIDTTALKFNQGSIVFFTGLAFLLNVYWLVAVVGIILLLDTIVSGTGLFKLTYKLVVKPLGLLKPNIVKESKTPHQFAQGMGGIFLLISFSFLQFLGLTFLGWILSFIVIALAFVNLSLNFCAGCFIYFQLQKIKLSYAKYAAESKNA
jgi:hypothetical protein